MAPAWTSGEGTVSQCHPLECVRNPRFCCWTAALTLGLRLLLRPPACLKNPLALPPHPHASPRTSASAGRGPFKGSKGGSAVRGRAWCTSARRRSREICRFRSPFPCRAGQDGGCGPGGAAVLIGLHPPPGRPPGARGSAAAEGGAASSLPGDGGRWASGPCGSEGSGPQGCWGRRGLRRSSVRGLPGGAVVLMAASLPSPSVTGRSGAEEEANFP